MPTKNEIDLQPLLDTQQNQLGLVMDYSTSIEAKALALLGANVAILIFIAQATLALNFWQYILLYLPFVVSLVLDIAAIWPGHYLGASVDLDELPEYLSMDRETLVLQLLADTQNAIEHNNGLNLQRMRFCIASLLVTSLGFFVLLLIL